MSDDTKRESAAKAGATRPAKKAAKKAAKKTAKKAATKAAKKTAKKVAARKTAKVKDTPAEASSPAEPKKAGPSTEARMEPPQAELNFSSVPDPGSSRQEPGPEPKAEPKPDAGGETAAGGAEGEKEVRFGRVPGGGPVKRADRKDREDRGSGEDRNDREDRGDREDREDRNERGDRQDRHGSGNESREDGNEGGGKRRRRRRRRRNRRGGDDGEGGGEGGSDEVESRPAVLEGPKVEVDGLLELAPKGFGFLRQPSKKFEQARDDVFVSPDLVRRYGLRVGFWLKGLSQQGPRGPQLVELTSVNDLDPDESRKLPAFEELKAINPNKRISFETVPERYTTRVIDLISPVGRDQRGLIVSPPRSGKTTLLLHVAEAVQELHDETLHPMVLLVDERPEEVTEFRRALPNVEIYASSNDEHPRNHTRIAEIAIERAKRLVEGGKHVFLVMDSITRLARAYNNAAGGKRGKGRGIGSGGVMVGALETPRRLFAAARNTREGGSLTILATALVQTNSRADDAIFQEFKGTGNMELVLDRKVAENYIYPAVDIFKSGTRREELLLPEHTLHKIHMIRRGLSGHRPVEAMERLLFFLKKFPNNPQMLLEIKG
jgi:transcription termination factor Rho